MKNGFATAMVFLMLAGSVALAEESAVPSFDCAQAASPVEAAICGNDALAALDRDVSQAFLAAVAVSAQPDDLRAAQHLWARERALACGLPTEAKDGVGVEGAACLSELYRQRLNDLVGQMLAESAADPGSWLTGIWQIDELLASSSPALRDVAQSGRLMALSRQALATLDGRACAGPSFRTLAATQARQLDDAERTLLAQLDPGAVGDADGVAGFCLGRLFGIYLPQTDGRVLVADSAALYRLRPLTGGATAGEAAP
ncbi:MAG: DUF1311 domain-containing protein [Rhodospirillaceae bacterium]|nr:DUF1311 domain-containing protein [Rhodospirillaceae bacterium]